jgi:hypothetical protein
MMGVPRSYRLLPVSAPVLLRAVGLLVLGGLLGACHAPGWDGYFSRGVGHLTQDEVRERFGPPHTAKTPALGGDSLWTYRIALGESDLDRWNPTFLVEASQSVGALMGRPSEQEKPTLYCYRYALTFSEEHILKDWKREECVPGTRNLLNTKN